MKKLSIKSLALVLSLLTLFGALSMVSFAKTSSEVDTHLQFNSDGSFKIMQIADIQDIFPMKPPTKKLLTQAVKTQSPDLIVLTGDNISSGTTFKFDSKAAINEFMRIFEKYQIPVAMVFGNHDDETTLATKAYQISVYEQYDCFVGCAGEDFGAGNLGTYYVPIYSSTDKDDMKFNVWMIDSGTYNSENDLGGYACTTKAQIDWYKKTSAELERANGGKIPSMMFQHIIVPEIYEALDEVEAGTPGSIEHAGKYYALPQGTNGELNESPCPPNYSNGQFDALLERGDVLAMFFGHDHVNSFELSYKGIDIVNTPGAGFNSYNNELVGVRVITLDESDLSTYETEVISYFDFFDYEDDCARYLYKAYSDTTSTETKIASFFKYIFACVLSLVK